MKVSGVPYCCGASILNGFTEDYYFNEKQERIKDVEKIQKLIIRQIGWDDRGKGIMLAITNRFQLPTVNILKKFGFKILKQFRNGTYGHKLTLWQLDLNKTSVYKIDRISDKLIKQLEKR